MSNYPITSVSGRALLAELPDYYVEIHETRIIMQAEGVKYDELQADIPALLDQQFIATATWDLSNWEVEFGIVPPSGQPIDQRRSVLQSKIRGYGKFSGSLLRNVAEAYINGEVDVIFIPGTSTFQIKFIGERGVPPNLADIQRTIGDIIPSHLLYEFLYTYLIWNELDTHVWNEIESYTWDALEIAFL